MLAALTGALAGTALWAAAGTLALSGPGGTRIGVLPPIWVLAVLLLASVSLALVLARNARLRTHMMLPALASAIGLLPWLPLRVPAAFLVWTRPLVSLVAAAVLFAVLFQWLRKGAATRPLVSDPRRAPLLAATVAAVVYSAAAWRVAPMIPGGDEPHYLIITQSLLYDFDLQIENNHARGDYRSYVALDLRPDYVARGTNGAIYSVHMPGVSALVAPAFLVAGHPGAAAFIVLIASLAGALLWRIAFTVAGDAGAAWFGWAAVVFSVPIVFHAFTLYPDSAATLPVLVGVWAMLHASRDRMAERPAIGRWILYGTALAALPWLHSRFALLAGGLGAMTVLRMWGGRHFLQKAAAFLAVPAISAAGWFSFFQILYGSPDPRAQYGGMLEATGSPWFVTSGVGGLLFDQQFGVLTRAPVYGCAIAGLGIMLLRSRRTSSSHARLAAEILLVITPYLISTTTIRMWWGGWSAPGRFVVPLLPLLGIAAAVAWRSASRHATRAVMLASLAVSCAMSAATVWVDRGRLAYDIRQTDALWLEWAGPIVNVARGVPTFIRSPEPDAWIQALVWIAALTIAWWILRAADGSILHTRSAVALGLAVLYAAAGMTALSIVWRLNGASAAEPAFAQLDLLRAVAERRGIGVALDPLARVPLPDIPSRLTIVPPPRHREGRDGQLMALPGPIPAGTYEVKTMKPVLAARTFDGSRMGPQPGLPPPEGQLTAGIGREFVPVWNLALQEGNSLTLDFPVDVRAIVIRRDEAAAPHVDLVSVHPRAVAAADRLPTREFARQAVRYGRTVAYFVDEGAFAERDAFWVRGGRTALIVIQPDDPRPAITVTVRNAPVENTLTIRSGAWQEEMILAPGEERRVGIPFDLARGSSLVTLTSASGFRPSEVQRGSGDHRFLGVWVRIE